ncbi:MAG TPA: IS4 family transposase, partial [Methylophaga sp.]|nr:IS4 family transposase [Methylophaga sp.]
MYPNQSPSPFQQKHISQYAASSDSFAFFNLLTSPDLFNKVESLLPVHRERLFPPTETLSMFLAQAMSTDSSCQKAINDVAVKRLLGGLPVCSTHTGAYCQARQRLPLNMIKELSCYTSNIMNDNVPAAWHWRGRPVRLVDGATVSMPDTEENQLIYPQPGGQKPGVGFPICRMVGMICLGSGALLNAAIGPCKGKGSDEQTLLRSILDTLNSDDILMGDAFYATYFLLCALQEKNIDGVFEQHGSRKLKTDFSLGQRLGERDHLISLKKPKKPDWMSQETYEQAPDSLLVRELRTGGKILVTTLLNHKKVSKTDLKMFYRERWNIEVDLRNIKTTLGMEIVSCRTPEMVEKEIWVYLLAYNLIRLLMAQAALLSNIPARQLSFKHTLQLWITWLQIGSGYYNDKQLTKLFLLIAQQKVGKRPGRIEPRAVKRRPKPFKLLTKPR